MEYQCHLHLFEQKKEKNEKIKRKGKNNPHNFEVFVFDVFCLSSFSQFVELTF